MDNSFARTGLNSKTKSGEKSMLILLEVLGFDKLMFFHKCQCYRAFCGKVYLKLANKYTVRD